MAKNIWEIDINYKPESTEYEDVKFYSVTEKPFSLEGLYKAEETGIFTRLPMEFKQRADLNDVAKVVMTHTAGAKVRFITDSPYVVLYACLGEQSYVMHHMADTGMKGFDMYIRPEGSRDEDAFCNVFIPNTKEDGSYSGSVDLKHSASREITINFPLYHNVDKVFVGLKEGASVKAPSDYAVEKPVVFYGSSITQGGCASRPGMAYPAILARKVGFRHVNLGFSGAGRGEQLVAEFIADMDMSMFVMDYDYNAVSLEHLQKTHYPFYETIRAKHPDIPIIMMTAPVNLVNEYRQNNPLLRDRRITIMNSYIKAVASGDENVYFVDGASLLGTESPFNSTVDGTHPNDYGFCHMADVLYPIVKRLLLGRY